jgi:hypothetical protein
MMSSAVDINALSFLPHSAWHVTILNTFFDLIKGVSFTFPPTVFTPDQILLHDDYDGVIDNKH